MLCRAKKNLATTGIFRGTTRKYEYRIMKMCSEVVNKNRSSHKMRCKHCMHFVQFRIDFKVCFRIFEE